MAEITDVLTKLLELTKENKIGWQTTSDEDVFSAVFGNQSVLVSGETLINLSSLKILNKAGVEIETLVGENDINKLHRIARRIALGVDSQLDELLSELDKKAQSPG